MKIPGWEPVAASNERVQRDYELGSDLVASRALTGVWLKGNSELEDLDIADRTRLMLFERRAILHWHNMFGVREAWRLFGISFEPLFRNFIQEEFAEADSADAAHKQG